MNGHHDHLLASSSSAHVFPAFPQQHSNGFSSQTAFDNAAQLAAFQQAAACFSQSLPLQPSFGQQHVVGQIGTDTEAAALVKSEQPPMPQLMNNLWAQTPSQWSDAYWARYGPPTLNCAGNPIASLTTPLLANSDAVSSAAHQQMLNGQFASSTAVQQHHTPFLNPMAAAAYNCAMYNPAVSAPPPWLLANNAKGQQQFMPSFCQPSEADEEKAAAADSQLPTDVQQQQNVNGTRAALQQPRSSAQQQQSSTIRHLFGPGTNNVKVRTKEQYRVVYNDFQRLELEKEYAANQYINTHRKTELSKRIHLNERQIKIWFQNRRAKERKVSKRRVPGPQHFHPHFQMNSF